MSYENMKNEILGLWNSYQSSQFDDGYGVRTVATENGQIVPARQVVRKASTIRRAERRNKVVHLERTDIEEKIKSVMSRYGFSDQGLHSGGRSVWNLINSFRHGSKEAMEEELSRFEKNFTPY